MYKDSILKDNLEIDPQGQSINEKYFISWLKIRPWGSKIYYS